MASKEVGPNSAKLKPPETILASATDLGSIAYLAGQSVRQDIGLPALGRKLEKVKAKKVPK